MAHYLISYDLHNRRDYTALYQLMAEWRAVRLHQSLWLAQLVGPAEAINRFIVDTLDLDDSSAVIEIKPGAQWAVMRAQLGGTNYLKAHFPTSF